MITIISPAKKLNLESNHHNSDNNPEFLSESLKLIKILKDYSPKDLQNLMGVSDKIAELNYNRYQNFNKTANLYPAISIFAGEVYNGLQAKNFSGQELDFANQHLRILSGLYGILKPLDLIKAYRLEMGSKLQSKYGKNLYDFWKNKITDYINNTQTNTVINLASTEYFSVISTTKLRPQIITPLFKEYKNNSYKTIMMYAKKARGLMARHIIKNKIQDWKKLMIFSDDGYNFNPELSDLKNSNKKLVFTRR